MATKNVLPVPKVLSTQTSPPWPSTVFREENGGPRPTMLCSDACRHFRSRRSPERQRHHERCAAAGVVLCRDAAAVAFDDAFADAEAEAVAAGLA